MYGRLLPARSVTLAALSLLLGCSSGNPEADAGASESPAPSLEMASALGVRTARMPVEGMLTAGQPTEEQLEGLLDAGFAHVISLRPESEDGAGWEETHASAAGYDFDRLPIVGAESLTRENVEAFAALLEETEGEPTVVYCASGNRVGAMLALKAFWLDGVEPEEALEIGLAGGMTRLTEPVAEILGVDAGG